MICSGAFSFNPKHWSGVSEDAQDFIKKMIVVDVQKRWTAEQLLCHPWMASAEVSGSGVPRGIPLAAEGKRAQATPFAATPGWKATWKFGRTSIVEDWVSLDDVEDWTVDVLSSSEEDDDDDDDEDDERAVWARSGVVTDWIHLGDDKDEDTKTS